MVLLMFTCIVYFPRLCLSYFVFVLAQFLRLLTRALTGAGNRKVVNRRILVITDYLPPQTHGIAIRVHAYVKEMRAQGHEVIVFATAYEADKETSFDHPNIPSVRNPFNLKNRIGYTPGVKLAWFLGMCDWDVVHLVFPSLIAPFVLSTCAWRHIPVYCSHHVELEMFAHEHVRVKPIALFGIFMYNLVAKWPAIIWGTLNAAPTLIFAKQHIGEQHEKTLRCVPSGTHDHFRPTPETKDERRAVRSERFGVDDDNMKVAIMVQRLSGEKGTERIFPAYLPKEQGGHGVPGALVICGEGPAKLSLQVEAARCKIRVVFLGNVPHHDLPSLYRAADCFVTMSLSETFGLTCLEAQMCGCPAVIPHCAVFDEIWNHRVPKAWRYEILRDGVKMDEFASAIKAAQNDKEFLVKNPVNQTWKIAADQLLEQYEEAMKLNEKKKERHGVYSLRMAHFLRVLLISAPALAILNRYYMALKSMGNYMSQNTPLGRFL